jgi:hypothetical protein
MGRFQATAKQEDNKQNACAEKKTTGKGCYFSGISNKITVSPCTAHEHAALTST